MRSMQVTRLEAYALAVAVTASIRPGSAPVTASSRAGDVTEQFTWIIQGPGFVPVPPFPFPGGIIFGVSVTPPARGGDPRQDLSSTPERAVDPLGAGLAATAPGWLSARGTGPAGPPGGARRAPGWWPSGGPA